MNLFAHNLGRKGHMELGHGYDAQVFMSKDKGKTWEPDIKKVEKSPMFPGRHFGSPCFINYGKDHAGATDGFIYAVSGVGWANGDSLKVGRTPADKIMDVSAWQFVAGLGPDGSPIWTDDQMKAKPVLEDLGWLGCPEVIYIASLKRYLFVSWRFKKKRPDKYSPDDGSELVIYEAPKPWGPFAVVTRMDWETPQVTPYNPRIPLKWFDAEKLEGWMLYSGSWRNGGKSEFYRAHIRRFRLTRAVANP